MQQGLTDSEVLLRRQKYGKNNFHFRRPRRFYHIVLEIVLEPMFIMLVIACSLYFLLGENPEGFMMLEAMIIVAGISFYQDVRSTVALDSLRNFTEPKVIVVRNGNQKPISSEELVPGDIISLVEGNRIPADAEIIESNDLSVNESVITGESLPAEKNTSASHNQIYQGTTIVSGRCYAIVKTIGSATEFGKIGKMIQPYTPAKTQLQHQVNKFVKSLALFGIVSFIAVFIVSYLQSGEIEQSILWGLTLAMAAIPEEIPVAFSSFMALGSFRMSKLGIITRQPQTIENLGSVNVICLDKTGTITENRMSVNSIYDFSRKQWLQKDSFKTSNVLAFAKMASEHDPFDEMEKAIYRAFNENANAYSFSSLDQVAEYPLEGQPPMMTHIYKGADEYLVAGKGAPERIFNVCRLDPTAFSNMMQMVREGASKGFRIIAVASASVKIGSTLPASQNLFNWSFEGLISLYDPPRSNVKNVLKEFSEAGISIKLLTGDFAETAMQVAREVGIPDSNPFLTGEQVMKMAPAELSKEALNTTLFARMFPEAKMKVVDVLREQQKTVAMTGDGVNDAPALQLADVGIAMGKTGTEMAIQTADLVLTDDNLAKVADAIRHGRRIFNNLKKAVRYIISIHIPLLLTVTLPLIFSWKYPHIFSPIHVIFLELIMGPTCSIFFEREPAETGAMKAPPRPRDSPLFSNREILTSLIQGLMITAASLFVYQFSVRNQYSLEQTTTMVFSTLIIANLFLTFVMRSASEPVYKTIRYKNNLAHWIVIISAGFLGTIHLIPAVGRVFGMVPIEFSSLLICFIASFVSVFWIEIGKLGNRASSS